MWYHTRNRGWLPAGVFAGAVTRKPIKKVSSTNTHTPNTTPSDSDDTIHNMNMEMLWGSTLNNSLTPELLQPNPTTEKITEKPSEKPTKKITKKLTKKPTEKPNKVRKAPKVGSWAGRWRNYDLYD